jgi:hypothetical protein
VPPLVCRAATDSSMGSSSADRSGLPASTVSSGGGYDRTLGVLLVGGMVQR